jgi:hypothetical protein
MVIRHNVVGKTVAYEKDMRFLSIFSQCPLFHFKKNVYLWPKIDVPRLKSSAFLFGNPAIP